MISDDIYLMFSATLPDYITLHYIYNNNSLFTLIQIQGYGEYNTHKYDKSNTNDKSIQRQ